jgi:hypothetical protein
MQHIIVGFSGREVILFGLIAPRVGRGLAPSLEKVRTPMCSSEVPDRTGLGAAQGVRRGSPLALSFPRVIAVLYWRSAAANRTRHLSIQG